MNVAINGLGRIGRLVLRLLVNQGKTNQLHLVAINDLIDVDHLAYLIKYDSTHGPFSGDIHAEENSLVVNGQKIHVFSEKDPEKLPWDRLKVDYVIEATGFFTTKETAHKHISAGAKRVIISAPAKGDHIPTFVMGVNHEKYNPATDAIVSNASCTTNCLAPITKVLLDQFGIEEGLMTTVHAMTALQPSVDGPSRKDWRGGRAASLNIIPASTGAAKAVTLCLPEVTGKLTGMAFRVPVADVSVVDLTVKLSQSTSYKEICQAMKSASTGSMKGVLHYVDEDVVSSDFIGSTYSSIFDAKAGIALNDHFFKLISWYDNEMGYAARIVDLLEHIATKDQT